MTILSIDPGPTESAYVVIDADYRPLHYDKVDNNDLRRIIRSPYTADRTAIEMVASYGMPVGAEVFDTCVWIGRFVECSLVPTDLVFRRDVKLHLCGTARANDANITQALVDRFAKGEPNRGKGTKANPGWFHLFAGDIWQAYALAVYTADQGVTP